jgi:pimeloyl-ACP methyl ester carboxylesterase
MHNHARLLLLPGLGADGRLFAGLGKLCLPVSCARLPVPQRHDTMASYALRVAATLELRPEDWIGGSSFGSLVAADIARRRPLGGLVLIGGALTSATLIRPARWLGSAARWLPLRPMRTLLTRPVILAGVFRPVTPSQSAELGAMLTDTPDELLREGARLVGGYSPAIPLLCPVRAIHGSEDRVMRRPPLPHCRLVPGAGHALALTHPGEVTAFLDEVLCRRNAP